MELAVTDPLEALTGHSPLPQTGQAYFDMTLLACYVAGHGKGQNCNNSHNSCRSSYTLYQGICIGGEFSKA